MRSRLSSRHVSGLAGHSRLFPLLAAFAFVVAERRPQVFGLKSPYPPEWQTEERSR